MYERDLIHLLPKEGWNLFKMAFETLDMEPQRTVTHERAKQKALTPPQRPKGAALRGFQATAQTGGNQEEPGDSLSRKGRAEASGRPKGLRRPLE